LDAFSQVRDAVSDLPSSRSALRDSALTASVISLTPDAWKSLTSQLRQMAAHYHGRVAIDLQNLNNGQTWTYNANDLFPAASLIKVPIMIAVFERIHESALSLTETMTLRRHNRVGGSGALKWRPDGTRLTISQLLDHMIRESDNTAANMLIEAVGGIPYIQSQLPKVGLVSTQIHRQGMSLRSGYVARENYTTAREMAMLLRRIYEGKMIDPASSRLMLDYLLLKKPVASRLGKGLPVGWEIAHKTGLERRACHDSAIILTPHGDFLLTVLTGNNRAYKPAQKFIARIGHLTYRYYGGHVPMTHSRRRYYALAGRYRRSRRSHRRL
jgi:beta-lactamase class A